MNQTARTDANTSSDNAPNLMNQTARTDANTSIDYAPDLMYQTAISDANTNTNNDSFQTNNFDQTMKSVTFSPEQIQGLNIPTTPQRGQAFNKYQSKADIDNSNTSIMQAVSSTPIRRQLASILPTSPSPISKTFSSMIDAQGNRVCGFCRETFPTKKVLNQHLDIMHSKDMSSYDRSNFVSLPENSTSENLEFFTPSKTNTTFENSGARPKQKKTYLKPAKFDPYNKEGPDVSMIEEPDVTMADQSLATNTNRSLATIGDRSLATINSFDSEDEPINRRFRIKPQRKKRRRKKWIPEYDSEDEPIAKKFFTSEKKLKRINEGRGRPKFPKLETLQSNVTTTTSKGRKFKKVKYENRYGREATRFILA